MASPNLELVRSIYAAWDRGDYSSVEWADHEIEFAFVGYLDRDQAFADLGLAPDGDTR